jgi:hypothetical protein
MTKDLGFTHETSVEPISISDDGVKAKGSTEGPKDDVRYG